MQDFLESKQWAEIRGIFIDEANKLKADIPYREKDNDFIAKRYVAQREAYNAVLKVLRRIETKAIRLETNKTSYK